jgi:natural product precursor
MKNVKLNLLEKKEMNEVRGGLVYAPCECVCYSVNHNGQPPYNTERTAENSVKAFKSDHNIIIKDEAAVIKK